MITLSAPKMTTTLPQKEPHQEWCCSEGCGNCSPVQADFEYYREEDLQGNVLDTKSMKIWVSNCCNADLLLWDEQQQDFVDLEEKGE